MAEERKIELNINNQFNSVELSFSFFPDEELREGLKNHGFRWHKINKYWYATYSNETLNFVQTLLGKYSIEEKEITIDPDEVEEDETETWNGMTEADVRKDFNKALEIAKEGRELSYVLGWGLSDNDLTSLAQLHQDGLHKEKIESLLEDCNFHPEAEDFSLGRYEKYGAAKEVNEPIADNLETDEISVSKENVITQEDVDIILRKGGNISDSKYRIYEQFLKNGTLIENIDFLKSEYGIGGSSHNRVTNDKIISEMHDAKGISLTMNGSSSPSGKTLVSWSTAARRIKEFVKEETYLTDKEKEGYPAYAEEKRKKDQRYEIAEEFDAIVVEYNDYIRENGNKDEILNRYCLRECSFDYYLGNKVSYGPEGKTGTIALMRETLDKIIKKETHLTDRCKAILDVLNSDISNVLETEIVPAPEKKPFIDHFYVIEDLKANIFKKEEFNDLFDALKKYFALPKDKMKAFGIQNSNKLPGTLDFIQCKDGKDILINDYLDLDAWKNAEINNVVSLVEKELSYREEKAKENTYANTYDKIGDDYILHDSNISLLDNRRKRYFSDINIFITMYPNENMFIYELDNAGKKGKTCNRWSISCRTDNQILNAFYEKGINTVEALYDFIQRYKEDRSVWDFDNIILYQEEKKGVDVFSPFVEYKPLKDVPEKWNKVNFINAMLSGQIYAGEINERLTDDYAMDAANNFCKGIRIDMSEAVRKEMDRWTNSTYVSAGQPDEKGIIPVYLSSGGTGKTYYFDVNSNIAEAKRRFDEVTEGIERYNKMLEASCRKVTEENIDLTKIYVIKSLEKDYNTRVSYVKNEVLQGATVVGRMVDNELPVLSLTEFPVEDNKFYSVSNFNKRPTSYIEEDSRTIHMGNWEYLVTGKALKEMTSESFYFPHIRLSPENETFEQVQNNILKGNKYGVGDRANAVKSIEVLNSEYSRVTAPRTSALSDLISGADSKREKNKVSSSEEIKHITERRGETR